MKRTNIWHPSRPVWFQKNSDTSNIKIEISANSPITKEIIRKNIGIDSRIGVVNSRGIQKLFTWRIKFPDKYDDKGNEIQQ